MIEQKYIGVIVPYLSQGFVAGMMDAIHAVAQEHAVQVIVLEGSSEAISAAMLAHDYVAGWLLFLDSTGIANLSRSGAPIVAISAAGCENVCPVVVPDNWGGIQAVMRHLFAHGHEQIAFIGTMDNLDIQQRHASYRAALAERNLPIDPALAVDTQGYHEEHGRNAVRSLLEAGCSFTAVVTAGDFNALGAIEALRNASYRVPEDVAVTGFDDVPGAQFADPPLSTVRQRPEAIGKLAAETLLRMIGGEHVAPVELYAPTAPIWRRSCGCDTTQSLPQADLSRLRGSDWQTYLTTQLVLLAYHPLLLDASTTAAQLWPGGARLVDQLAAILDQAAAPGTADLEQSWYEAVALTDNLDILYALLKLIEAAGAQRLARLEQPGPVADQLALFFERNQLSMMRARLARDVVGTDFLDQIARTSQAIDMALLDNLGASTLSFDWLEHTQADWACLGLWKQSPGPAAAPALTIAGVYHRYSQANSVVAGGELPANAFPPAALLNAPLPPGKPSNVVVLPVATAARQWGVLALRIPTAKQVTYDLHGLKVLGPRLAAKMERDELLASLREQQTTLSQAYERERALASTIRDLGCPTIPLLEGVLLVPLIGVLDTARADLIITAVLQGISHYHASVILLDLTGVPLVDTQVANSLLQTAKAATLLGAQAILVGIRPEIAQSIVGLGLNLSHIVTFATLAAALAGLPRTGLLSYETPALT